MASRSVQKHKDQVQEHAAGKGEKGVAKTSTPPPRSNFIYWPEADQVKDPFFAVKIGPYSCLCGLTPDDEPRRESSQDDLHPIPKRRQPPMERMPSNSALTLASSMHSRRSVSVASDSRGIESFSLAAAAADKAKARSSAEEELGNLDGLSPAEVEEVQRFHANESRGRCIEAQRELRILELAGVDPAAIFPDRSLEHIRRIGMKYEESLKLLHGKFKDMDTSERLPDLKCEWGISIKGDVSTLLYSVEEPGLPLVLATAALMERDLQKAFNQGILRTERLGTPRNNEQFWRTWTYSRTAKAYADTVLIINAMDALDESVSAIWGSWETPSSDAARAQGVEIPPPDANCSRPEYSLNVWQITPLHELGHGDRRTGLRMRMQVDVKLPKVMQAVVSVMPWIAIKRWGRSRISKMVADFNKFVTSSQELEERVRTSEHRAFYAALHEHLGESRVKHAASVC